MVWLGNGLESIIECCGSGLCNSNNAGVRLSTGQSITADSDITIITLTCPDDQQLIGLDDQGNIICEDTITTLPPLLITTNTFNYNIFTSAGSPTEPVRVTVTINSGIIVGSTDTSIPALTIENFAGGSRVTIINNGVIVGRGGNGGAGFSTSGTSGKNGGTAISTTVPLSIENNGFIGGGGGGGQGGKKGTCGECYDDFGSSGGGGAGQNGGKSPNTCNGGCCQNGKTGSLEIGGNAGSLQSCGSQEWQSASKGQNGGDLGQNGGGIKGGAPGDAITGVSQVTFIGPQGDIRGPTI